jgi:protease-4
VQDLQSGLAKIRAANKPVHCHFETADNASYALMAASCDRISMTPAGTLNLVGLSMQAFYARQLLERIGGHADILHVGRYKGAGDTLTRDEMPEAARESLGALLDDLQSQLLASVLARNEIADIAEPLSAAVFQHGPYTAEAARTVGLVDDVGFDDEARDHARVAAGVEVDQVRTLTLRKPQKDLGLSDIVSAFAGDQESTTVTGERIALVYLSGSIVDGTTPKPGNAVSGPFVEAMRGFARDEDVKAIVLRINSPGGSALASDRMWHAVRRAAAHKPVIASIGDVAASGGYYIACGATVIYAHETSVVGSIGVVGGKVSFGGLAEEVGVNAVTLRHGPYSDWTNGFAPFDEAQRASIQGLLNSTYWRFLRRVAVGRGMAQREVHEIGQGRVWSGAAGHRLNLIDEVGGLDDAIARATADAALEDPEVEVWPRPRSVLESISAAMGGDQEAQAQLESARGALRWNALLQELGPVGDAANQLPSLLEHEHIAVAMPYVLVVE